MLKHSDFCDKYIFPVIILFIQKQLLLNFSFQMQHLGKSGISTTSCWGALSRKLSIWAHRYLFRVRETENQQAKV